ncbi:hypothetical protein EDB80DRAFT_239877 [Ilyonectria destructans]|nr:hypothetical protein EDB80DRAFT_239877 [Ilyonectria destructans]
MTSAFVCQPPLPSPSRRASGKSVTALLRTSLLRTSLGVFCSSFAYPLNPYPLPPTSLPFGLSFCSFVPMRTRRYDLPLSVPVHLLHNVWCYQAFAVLAQASLSIFLSAQRGTLFVLATIPFHGPSNYDKAGDDTRRARQTHVKRHTTHD